jgi:hypothetical protein
LNYLKIITIRRFWEEAKNNSVLPSTFFQNFQCCNNGFRFGIRVEDDTIMTFWVYWLVKSLTCFNVHIYALSIYYKILFIILLLYTRHSFFGEGKEETQCLVLFPYLLPNIALSHLSIFNISFIFSFFYYCIYCLFCCIYRFTCVSPFTSIFVLHLCSSFPN